MAKRNDIKKIILFGSGPIVIGQACEFDYSGTQACKALVNEGYEVILVNSNPATIMTDPEVATRVYIEPLEFDYLKKILEIEKPDALIPTLGGQTALNLALELSSKGVLKDLGVELIGADAEVIDLAEDREKFRNMLQEIGAKFPKSVQVNNLKSGLEVAAKFGYPLILRPNFTLGGGGGGIAYSEEEFQHMVTSALRESPTSEVLVEQSIIGWKEYELEVMRDSHGSFVVICSIENLDACGVHTGDSITVAPQQTLSDREYQEMRDEAQLIIEKVGLATGGANIQFAVDPETRERVVIEMNPRVSRSSALASKATGFPIAKIAALVAIGYRLDELKNDITKTTYSCYEPSLDYVVTKIPKFVFEKFKGTPDHLTTQMKSVGEVMAIGRTFKESFGKAIASLEDINGFSPVFLKDEMLSYPNSKRLLHLAEAFRQNYSVEKVKSLSLIDSWFLEQIQEMVSIEGKLKNEGLNLKSLLKAKRVGMTDAFIGEVLGKSSESIEKFRVSNGLLPAFYQVDTCAGEFVSETPYYYSTYWAKPSDSKFSSFENSIAVVGSGPNRIGQGVEFDYCCVRGVKRLMNLKRSVIMINSNPETVSTDYDTSDILFFEPLTVEHVAEVLRFTKAEGFISQLGGQTPLSLVQGLIDRDYKMFGSDKKTIDLAEDRAQFTNLCEELGVTFPISGMASSIEEAKEISKKIEYPIMCRPSYVLGGRRMEVVESFEELASYFEAYKEVFKNSPCLMDQFLENALEVDVDVVRAKDWKIIGGVVEHIEAAGIHSGDSMGVIPPQRLKEETLLEIEKLCFKLADSLNIIGHLNVQIAIKNDVLYVLEANPRSSRTVPFISKATGIPLVDLAIDAIMETPKEELSLDKMNWKSIDKVYVKGVVFPFKKFKKADSILGPEMKSTGETMGVGANYSEALLKALISSEYVLREKGEVFLSLREKDKEDLLDFASSLVEMKYTLSATTGTAKYLSENGIKCLSVNKVHEGRPHCVDRIRSNKISLVINTTSGRRSVQASFGIRRSCVDYSIPCITESHAAEAFLLALKQKNNGSFEVYPLNAMKA